MFPHHFTRYKRSLKLVRANSSTFINWSKIPVGQSFPTNEFTKKIIRMAQLWPLLSIFVLYISGIRTRVVRVVGEHADHLTTRYAPPALTKFYLNFICSLKLMTNASLSSFISSWIFRLPELGWFLFKFESDCILSFNLNSKGDIIKALRESEVEIT